MFDNDLAFNEVYYAANAGIFLAGLLLSILFMKFLKNSLIRSALALIAVCAFSAAFWTHARQANSKYKAFDIKRCANKREIISRFRLWSRVVHPDSQNDLRDDQLTYEELDTLKEFLSDSNKRLFYDKFNLELERQDLDEKEAKEIYSHLFQNKLFEYLNLTFAWIFVAFLISKYLKRLELTNFVLKVIIAKSFLLIYYLYSQGLDTCSLLDDVFGHLTIAQQIYYVECWFAFIFGMMLGFYNSYSEGVRQKALGKISQALEVLKGQKEKSESEGKLMENIQNYYHYLSN
jgi:hypothetical protein